MTTPDATAREDRQSLVQVGIAVALLVAVLALVGAQLALERRRELDRATRSIRNIAAAVTEHAEQAIDEVAAELGEVVAAIEDGGPASVPGLTAALERGATPFVHELFLLDATGRVVTAASPLGGELRSFHDTELFAHHRSVPSADVFISDPGVGIVGDASGLQVVRVSRRLSRPDGSFAGVVVGSLSIEPMRALYNRMDLGVGGVITLFRADGLVLVRVPAGGPFGASIRRTAFYRDQIAGHASGVFDLTSPLDGVVRLTAFDHDDARRLLVTVGIPRDEVLRDWTRRAAVALVTALLLVALLTLTYRQRVRGLRDAERRARDSARRFRALADASADLAASATVDEILERVTAAACLVVPASHASIHVMTGRKGPRRYDAPDPARRTDAPTDDLPGARGALVRDVLLRGAPARLTGAEVAGHAAWTEGPDGVPPAPDGLVPPRGWIGVPLVDADRRAFGVLEVYDRRTGEFTEQDQALLEQLARMTAATLETRRLADDMTLALSAAEDARVEAERGRLDLIDVFNTTTDAFYSLDHDWRLTFVNAQAERILARRREDMLGRVLWDVLPQTVGTLLDEEFRVAVRDGEAREFRYYSETLERWLDVRAFPHEQGLSVYFRDVTEQIALDAQMHQAQKMDAVGQLTGGIAHDFNNLLTVILGSADVLVDALEDDDLRGLADTTRIAAEKAAALTQRLLAFSRRQPLAPRVVDVADLVARLEALMRRTLGEHIDIVITRAAGTWPAMVDPSQLENAILNLAINARDAMPGGGQLLIDVANARIDEGSMPLQPDVQAGAYVCVAVTDTGTGMTPEVAARAFEPFFTTKDVGRGSGLGLSMVYGFARQSGGHVALYSEPGRGTVVRLYLPRADVGAAAIDETSVREDVPRGTERVALVEDQDLVRLHTEAVMRDLGYDVTSFPDGPSLIAEIDEGLRPQLLLTDVVLPGGMNGRDVATHAAARIGGLKVLYMSGYSEDTLMHEGRLEDGVQLIGKPFRRADLARKVRRVLDDDRGASTASASS